MHKIILLFAAIAIAIGLFGINNVPYIDADGVLKHKDNVGRVTTYTDTLTTGWYVVAPSDTRTGTITCNGEVHLILSDDAKLVAKGSYDESTWTGYPGIRVSGEGNSLTIYGQTNQTGKLIATGGEMAAGIGGGNYDAGSNITINGGVITAHSDGGGAGIGGGLFGDGSNITINSGIITASCEGGGAGIGGGHVANGYDITINGGVITATGGIYAAGIGGGAEGSAHDITINGGKITANGGKSNDSDNNVGDGIGNGCYNNVDAINIKVSADLIVKAGATKDPTTMIATTRTTATDIADDLAGLQYVTIEAETTGLQNVNANTNASKFIHNGQVIIRKNNQFYNILGTKLK